jgi:hypothetical protein
MVTKIASLSSHGIGIIFVPVALLAAVWLMSRFPEEKFPRLRISHNGIKNNHFLLSPVEHIPFL